VFLTCNKQHGHSLCGLLVRNTNKGGKFSLFLLYMVLLLIGLPVALFIASILSIWWAVFNHQKGNKEELLAGIALFIIFFGLLLYMVYFIYF
jgi:hypothetical protein